MTTAEENLQTAEKILLIRAKNGWILRDTNNADFKLGADCFVFESTQSLQKALPGLIGSSGWKIEPARDEKGHFTKQP